jgi:ParB family chromosome partitioning protein
MARRPGLGKGLNALIPQKDDQSLIVQPASSQGVLQVAVDQVKPNPQQPRINIDQDSLKELSASIAEHGIVQPLIVSYDQEADQYTLIAGERRLLAAKMAGLTMVPVIERTVTDQEQLELALIENLQRSDLNPLEMAEAYQQLAENFNLTHDQIATRVGKSRTSVTNTLRLLNLPDQVQKALLEGFISEGHARALLSLRNSKSQRAALSTILTQELNVRQTEALVKKLSGERPAPKPKDLTSPEIRDLENRLRTHFGTKVNVNNGKNGGSLVIYYYSEEELNTILDKILPE